MPYHNLPINVRDDQREREEAILDTIRRYKANHRHIKTLFEALAELVMKGDATFADKD